MMSFGKMMKTGIHYLSLFLFILCCRMLFIHWGIQHSYTLKIVSIGHSQEGKVNHPMRLPSSKQQFCELQLISGTIPMYVIIVFINTVFINIRCEAKGTCYSNIRKKSLLWLLEHARKNGKWILMKWLLDKAMWDM